MSLRGFHLLFIALSVVLTVFVAAWAVDQYETTASAGYLVTTFACVISGAALAVYGRAFQRKSRGL